MSCSYISTMFALLPVRTVRVMNSSNIKAWHECASARFKSAVNAQSSRVKRSWPNFSKQLRAWGVGRMLSGDRAGRTRVRLCHRHPPRLQTLAMMMMWQRQGPLKTNRSLPEHIPVIRYFSGNATVTIPIPNKHSVSRLSHLPPFLCLTHQVHRCLHANARMTAIWRRNVRGKLSCPSKRRKSASCSAQASFRK